MTRIHIFGASGSGTSTLGRAMADELAAPHFDTDDFYWLPTNPRFITPRPAAERLALLRDRLVAYPSWVLSGSALKWGEPLTPLFDFVVFLTLDSLLRMERLRVRERTRYGDRIEPGGDMAEASAAFLAWAATYDTAGLEQRSRGAHEAWLANCPVPTLRLNSSEPLKTLTAAVLSFAKSRVSHDQVDHSRSRQVL